MNQCESRENVKKVKRQKIQNTDVEKQNFQDQPKSTYRFYMDNYMKWYKDRNQIEVDRMGFESWKKISKEKSFTYAFYARRAEKVNDAYTKSLREEELENPYVNEEADSREVGKFDQATNGFKITVIAL